MKLGGGGGGVCEVMETNFSRNRRRGSTEICNVTNTRVKTMDDMIMHF